MFYALNLTFLAGLFLNPNKLRPFIAAQTPFIMSIYIISSYDPVSFAEAHTVPFL